MILAIDIGNSNIVIGAIDGDAILFEARLRTDATKTSDEYCIDIKSILDINNLNSKIILKIKVSRGNTRDFFLLFYIVFCSKLYRPVK